MFYYLKEYKEYLEPRMELIESRLNELDDTVIYTCVEDLQGGDWCVGCNMSTREWACWYLEHLFYGNTWWTLEYLPTVVDQVTTPGMTLDFIRDDMSLDIRNVRDIILEDDESEFGGISHNRETLGEFLDEVDIDIEENWLQTVNDLLKQNGIKEVHFEE